MTLPFVFSIPHGSNRIPETIEGKLAISREHIGASVDMGTMEIFSGLPARAVVAAEWNRLVVDLNRSPEAMDYRGVIAAIDYDGRSVYQPGCYPDSMEIMVRLRTYYRPYHFRLTAALTLPGVRGLFDCHSLNGVGPLEAPDRGCRRKDIILGNNGDPCGECRPGAGPTTCAPPLLRHMAQIFGARGFTVAMNDPYAGGYITMHYGQQLAAAGRFAVQIEINQDLFLASDTRCLDPVKAGRAGTRIRRALEDIARIPLQAQ